MCGQDLTHSLDTARNISVKNVPQVVIRDVCGTWYGLFTVSSFHSIQKSTRNSQKLGNTLASRQVDDSRFKVQNRVKKSEEKEKMFKRRNWLVLHMWSNIKTVVEEHVSSENVTYILLVDVHDEVAMYHQQTNWYQQTIEQTKVI